MLWLCPYISATVVHTDLETPAHNHNHKIALRTSCAYIIPRFLCDHRINARNITFISWAACSASLYCHGCSVSSSTSLILTVFMTSFHSRFHNWLVWLVWFGRDAVFNASYKHLRITGWTIRLNFDLYQTPWKDWNKIRHSWLSQQNIPPNQILWQSLVYVLLFEQIREKFKLCDYFPNNAGARPRRHLRKMVQTMGLTKIFAVKTATFQKPYTPRLMKIAKNLDSFGWDFSAQFRAFSRSNIFFSGATQQQFRIQRIRNPVMQNENEWFFLILTSRSRDKEYAHCAVIFSRSYCYTVWSTIGIILSSVNPSVYPSHRLSVTLCIVALRVGVHAKSCTSVFLAGKFLFTLQSSDTFPVGCIV